MMKKKLIFWQDGKPPSNVRPSLPRHSGQSAERRKKKKQNQQRGKKWRFLQDDVEIVAVCRCRLPRCHRAFHGVPCGTLQCRRLGSFCSFCDAEALEACWNISIYVTFEKSQVWMIHLCVFVLYVWSINAAKEHVPAGVKDGQESGTGFFWFTIKRQRVRSSICR